MKLFREVRVIKATNGRVGGVYGTRTLWLTFIRAYVPPVVPLFSFDKNDALEFKSQEEAECAAVEACAISPDLIGVLWIEVERRLAIPRWLRILGSERSVLADSRIFVPEPQFPRAGVARH